jgi:2-hydroxychromene-2-carboxylate isomerase
MPSKFPIGTTAPARAFYAIADSDPAAAKRLASALYGAYFAEDRDISSPEVTAHVAWSIGLDGVAQAMSDVAIKERLRREVDAAIARGVFGSPYIVVDGEPFWGSDRLDQVDKWLASGGW